MLKTIISSLLLVACTQAFTITFPVGVNPPGGWWFGPSNGEYCSSTVRPWQGLADSKHDCTMDALKNTYGFGHTNAENLIRYATGPQGTPGQTGHPTIADNNSRKALCKAADDCSCRIYLDWCQHYDDIGK